MLDSYGILDTPEESEFGDIVRLAADAFSAPIAVVNLVSNDRQWFKAEIGIGTRELPLDVSICVHAILQNDFLVVPDTREDPRFACNPLVTSQDGLRFYAGAILRSAEGLPIGTVCVLDREPRPLGITAHQRLVLEVLARQVMTQLELRKLLVMQQARADELLAEIAQRTTAESALRSIEERFRLAIRATNDAIWDWDFATNHVTWNESLEAAHGHNLDHVVPTGEWWIDHIHPDDRESVDRSIHAAIDGKSDYWSSEYRFLRGDGTYASIFDRGHIIRDAEGRATRMIGAMLDITERLATRAELAISEERLRLATHAAEVGFWDVDLINDILIWPPILKRMFGISADVAVSLTDFYGGLHPDDLQATSEMFAAACDPEERALYDVEYRTVGKEDGLLRWVAAKGRGIFDSEGRCTRVVGTAIDVTVRKRAEKYQDALVRLADQFNEAADPEAIGFAAAEIVGEVLEVSQVGYATLDLIAETLHVERDWNAPGISSLAGVVPLSEYGSFIDSLKRGEFISIEDVDLDERTAVAAAALQARSASSFVNVPVIEHDRLVAVLYVNHGTAREWHADELAFIKEVASRTRGAVERNRNAAALRDLNATLEERIDERSAALRLHANIIQSDVTAICAFDTEYRLIAFNKAHNDEFFRVNGFYTKLGDVFWELFIPEQREIMRAQMTRALSGEPFTVEEEFGNPEIDAPRWEIHYSPLRDEAGRIIGAFHHARDISARLRAQAELADTQEALRQAQKVEAMGLLTGGVAHDFNNLLTPIVGVLDLLQLKNVGSEREQRLIGGAAQSAERARVLVQRLLAFARRQPLQTVSVDLAKLIAGMTELVTSTIGPKIRLEIDTPGDLPLASADVNQLEMAVLNLALNARDAMPEGGVLKIAATPETLGYVKGHDLKPGRYIRLSISDTGAGMDGATLARAIEPFFSTKGVGQGTGLGLSMVHGLASQLDGALHITSKVDQGTTIELWLPESRMTPDAVVTAPETAAPDKRGTALLVDDEEFVRLSTSDMLADLGYKVVEADSAEAALALVDGGVTPDLVVTDHLMPGMTGSELARTIRSRFSAVPVLIISGYAESEGLEPDLPRLTKPFRRDELLGSLTALGA